MKRGSDRDIRKRYAPVRHDLQTAIDALQESNDTEEN